MLDNAVTDFSAAIQKVAWELLQARTELNEQLTTLADKVNEQRDASERGEKKLASVRNDLDGLRQTVTSLATTAEHTQREVELLDRRAGCAG